MTNHSPLLFITYKGLFSSHALRTFGFFPLAGDVRLTAILICKTQEVNSVKKQTARNMFPAKKM